jgi:hypothetical protein
VDPNNLEVRLSVNPFLSPPTCRGGTLTSDRFFGWRVDAFVDRKHFTRGVVTLLSSSVNKVGAFNAFRSMLLESI